MECPAPAAQLERNVDDLLKLLRTRLSSIDDTDDNFFHIMCHLDDTIKSKIAKGQFVDLDRLIPKTKGQIMTGQSNDIEVVRRDGSMYILPENINRETKITNVRRWEQAFRVYAAVYSQANPDRAAEIWQYVHVINTAAQSYTRENVSFYDASSGK